MAKKSYGLKPAWTFFILALALVGISLSDIGRMFWTPPKPSQMITVTGRFEPHSWQNDKCYSFFCPRGSYSFVAEDGQRISLNCEPEPARNQCLDGNAKNKRIRNVEDGTWRITYFDNARVIGGHTFNVVTEAELNDEMIIRHDETIARIKNSSVWTGTSGKSVAGVVLEPPQPVTVDGGPVIRALHWFYLGFLALMTVILVVVHVRKLFRL